MMENEEMFSWTNCSTQQQQQNTHTHRARKTEEKSKKNKKKDLLQKWSLKRSIVRLRLGKRLFLTILRASKIVQICNVERKIFDRLTAHFFAE